jgi:molecular chaperone GrpE
LHILTLEGVTELSLESGSDFDSNTAEVLTTIEDEANKGKVSHVVRKGYTIGERVLRTAKVIVGK